MEPINGAFLDGEWDCFHQMFAAEELEFAPQFIDLGPLLIGQDEEVNFDIDHSKLGQAFEASKSMPLANENMFYSFDALNYDSVECISQQSSFHGDTFFVTTAPQRSPFSTHSTKILPSDHNSTYMVAPSVKDMCDFSSTIADMMMRDTARLNEESNGDAAMGPKNQQGPVAIPQNQMNLKRKLEVQELPGCAEYISKTSSVNQKKKSRVSRDVPRTERNAQAKESQKQIPNANREKEIDAGISGGQQSYSSCSTEEDSASLETNGGVTWSSNASTALQSNGKTRACRVSATDPQSLYARKRRERINERLRILQHLVPNGTKLLSSNDLWMYAPIAYNGIDMGLTRNMKISSPF